jgi:hypothetical protein
MDFAVDMSCNATTSQSWDRPSSCGPLYPVVLSKTLKEIELYLGRNGDYTARESYVLQVY